jgi:hypothetical protein
VCSSDRVCETESVACEWCLGVLAVRSCSWLADVICSHVTVNLSFVPVLPTYRCAFPLHFPVLSFHFNLRFFSKEKVKIKGYIYI